MKKFIAIAAVATFTACNPGTTETTTETTTDTVKTETVDTTITTTIDSTKVDPTKKHDVEPELEAK
jgi:hypothetical protein